MSESESGSEESIVEQLKENFSEDELKEMVESDEVKRRMKYNDSRLPHFGGVLRNLLTWENEDGEKQYFNGEDLKDDIAHEEDYVISLDMVPEDNQEAQEGAELLELFLNGVAERSGRTQAKTIHKAFRKTVEEIEENTD